MILSQRDPEGVEIEYLHRMVDFSDSRVLEIGSGDGRITRRYMDEASQVVAIDLDEPLLQEALTSTDPFPEYVHFMRVNATQLPYTSQHFSHALLAWSL